jgi:hypothetical protein
MGHATVEHVHQPSPARFEQLIREHRPAILTGLVDDQLATRRWDLSYFRETLGDRAVKVVDHDRPRIHWDPKDGLPLRASTFGAFIDEAFERKAAGFHYLQDDVNAFPGIQDDYHLPSMMTAKRFWRTKLWLSGAGLITPLHFDPVETLHWVVRGAKRFVSYAPGVRKYYPYPTKSTASFISQVDPDDPRPDRFPRFRHAIPVEFTVNEGEILYLPAFWWHQVYSEGAVNLSLNFVWFTSWAKSLRHFPQLYRTRRQLAQRVAQARAQARATTAEAR